MDALRCFAQDFGESLKEASHCHTRSFPKQAKQAVNAAVCSHIKLIAKMSHSKSILEVLSARIQMLGARLIVMIDDGEVKDIETVHAYLQLMDRVKLGKFISDQPLPFEIEAVVSKKRLAVTSILTAPLENAQMYQDFVGKILDSINKSTLSREFKNIVSRDMQLAISALRSEYRRSGDDESNAILMNLIKVRHLVEESLTFYEVIDPLLNEFYETCKEFSDENLKDCYCNYVVARIEQCKLQYLEEEIPNLAAEVEKLKTYIQNFFIALLQFEKFCSDAMKDIKEFPITESDKTKTEKWVEDNYNSIKDALLTITFDLPYENFISDFCKRFNNERKKINEYILNQYINSVYEEIKGELEKKYLPKLCIELNKMIDEYNLRDQIENSTITTRDLYVMLDYIEDKFQAKKCQIVLKD
jgi:uncharacterized membrane protein YheB (UPF0754 family)